MKKGGRFFFLKCIYKFDCSGNEKKLMNLFIVYIMLRFVIRYIREERFFLDVF